MSTTGSNGAALALSRDDVDASGAAGSWHTTEVDHVAAELESSTRTGLDDREAAWRLSVYRAERALEALRQLAAPTATVVRGGRERDVPAGELVPGNLVRLAAGDKVPADGRVCNAIGLAVEKAALTGESLPVEKTTAALRASSLPLGDRTSMVYAGTTVTHGRGSAVVVSSSPAWRWSSSS
jgi:E1-E2 ATPase